MGSAETVYTTSSSLHDSDEPFYPPGLDPRMSVSELWTLRQAAERDLQRHYAAEDKALADGLPLAERNRIARLTDGPFSTLSQIDERIVRTPPKSLLEHALMVSVLELHIDDDGIPDEFLHSYCATIRKMALS
jgi:hypothetical protein